MSTPSLARNSAIQIVGKVVAMVLAALTLPLLTRALGDTGYGQLTIALTFLSFFAILVDFGLTLTTTQMISEKPKEEGAILGNLLTLRVISSVLFLATAPIIVLFFPYSGDIKTAVAIGALSFFFGSTAQMLVGVFQTRLVMRYPIAAELANRAFVLAGAFALVAINGSLLTIVWILTIGNALQLLINLYFANRFIPLKPTLSLPIWKEIIRRSWPIGISIFFNLLYLKGDMIVLSLYATESVNGLYGAAYKVVDVMMALPVMYMGLVLPILVARYAEQNKMEFQKTLQQTFDLFSMSAIPLAVGCWILGVPVMTLVAGNEFAESGRVLAILGAAIAVGFFGALSGHAIVAIQKQRVMLFGYIFVAALVVPAYFLFIPTFGMYGAAWMTLVSEILICLLTSLVVWRTTKFIPNLKLFGKSLLASAFMAFLLTILPEWNVLILVIVGIASFFNILSLLGGPTLRSAIKSFV